MTPTAVHPHLPRLGQAVTGVLCVEALLFRDPWVVAAALLLVAIGLVAPRWSPVHWFFKAIARPATELEPVAPVRFSQRIAVGALALALVLLIAGADLAGWIVAGLVAGLALLSATTGLCVGCEAYRLLLARRGAEGDVRGPLGLDGAGPWLVVLTAPGCARCEPIARELEDVAGARPVVRVDLTRTPGATRLPVRSVPAVIAVGRDGHVIRALAGRLDRGTLEEAAAAV